jgi:hypothetical protein
MCDDGSVTEADDVVCVFGVPAIMARMGEKLGREMRGGREAWHLSLAFEVPLGPARWERVHTAGGIHFCCTPLPWLASLYRSNRGLKYRVGS